MSERIDVKIFIASSSELNSERTKSSNVIVEINKTFPHLHLEPILFELDTASGSNPGYNRIQDKINPLIDKCDVIVVLFYSRIGEFTKEEFDRAKKQDKKIFLYLKEGYQPKNVEESNKHNKVLLLKEDVEKESRIRYQAFKEAEYHGLFYIDLNKYLTETYPSLQSVNIEEISISFKDSENKLKQYPLPKPYFIGREKEIEEFQKAIIAGNNFIAIDGPGGIGKTQFVSKCIEKHIPKDKIILYKCNTASQLDTLISEAGYPELLKGSSKTDKEKFSAFKDKIQEGSLYLFLDNFQETNNNPAFKEFVSFSQEYLQKGSIIVIDRDNIQSLSLTPKRIHILGLKERKLDYAKALIQHSYKDILLIDDVELERLCDELKGYPLAIDFAILLLSDGVSSSDIIKKMVEDDSAELISERLLNEIFSRPDATDDEKNFIKQFSVFTESVSFETVKGIISDKLFQTAPKLLQKKNLLSYVNGFYEIHPLVREFCYKALVEKEVVHAKAAEYYTSQRKTELSPVLEEQIFYHLAQSKQWGRIEVEIEEKGRHLIWFGQLGLVITLLDKLKDIDFNRPIFNIFYGDIAEIQGRWDDALIYFDNAQWNNQDKKVQTEGIIKYGEMMYRKGNIKEALPYYEKAFQLSRENQFLKEEARALNDIGLVYLWLGEMESSLKNFNEAYQIRLKINDKEGIASSLLNIASIYAKQGKLNDALITHRESLKKYEEISDKSGIANSLSHIGSIFKHKEELNEALLCYKKSLSVARIIGNKAIISGTLNLIGNIYSKKNRLTEALKMHNDSLNISQILGYKSAMASAAGSMGTILQTMNNLTEAEKMSKKGLELFLEIGDKKETATSLNNIGNI
ncbi:tetratricopeptide repeat protein [Mucilaginibacter sp.]|uniref:tetratricopeptide repeat protein n=1 Tax=Mucilaginibacter sp. TaxID=1882438 RepID=UPI002635B986|nr:tetratricopeptide repeat protein [Mucilaginibacter sp.]MDB4918975.1 hypothetical protein [Mucilaginibacter sp.]